MEEEGKGEGLGAEEKEVISIAPSVYWGLSWNQIVVFVCMSRPYARYVFLWLCPLKYYDFTYGL